MIKTMVILFIVGCFLYVSWEIYNAEEDPYDDMDL